MKDKRRLVLSEGLGWAPVRDIQFKMTTFPGGEPHIQIEGPIIGIDVIVEARLNSFNDLGSVLVAVDALQRMSPRSISLFAPYMPGARQDRVSNPGEALTAKVYADIINSMGLDQVIILDPHSDTITALLNKVTVFDNHIFVSDAIRGGNDYHLISPDAGASKKVIKLAQFLHHKDVIMCGKTRDTVTGKLSGFEVYADDLGGKDCIIVDDICDGGGTFMGLAQELKNKNAGDLYLVVSHGIFSKGTADLRRYFKEIYTTNSIHNKVEGVNVIEL